MWFIDLKIAVTEKYCTRRVWTQCGFDFNFGRKQVNKKIPDFLKKSGISAIMSENQK
jgi:hypothetical protein